VVQQAREVMNNRVEMRRYRLVVLDDVMKERMRCIHDDFFSPDSLIGIASN
jgi:hypothetical protein